MLNIFTECLASDKESSGTLFTKGICAGIQTCNSKFLACTKPLFDGSVYATEMFNTLKLLHNTMLYIEIWMSLKKTKTKTPASCSEPLAYLQLYAAHEKQLTGEK